MSNQTIVSPAKITEADVAAYLTSEAIRLSSLFQGAYCNVKLEATRTCSGAVEVQATAYVDDGGHLQAPTLAEAITRQQKEFTATKIKMLREKAGELMKQAAALEAKGQEVIA